MNAEKYLGKDVRVTLKNGEIYVGKLVHDVWSDGSYLIQSKREDNWKVRRIVSDSEIQSIEVVE